MLGHQAATPCLLACTVSSVLSQCPQDPSLECSVSFTESWHSRRHLTSGPSPPGVRVLSAQEEVLPAHSRKDKGERMKGSRPPFRARPRQEDIKTRALLSGQAMFTMLLP